MNCKNVENYMNSLSSNDFQESDNTEILNHIESCDECTAKWELNEESKSKLKHYIKSIKASDEFRAKLSKQFTDIQTQPLYIKPLMLAASIAFLIGIGLFTQPLLIKNPTLPQLHSKNYTQVISNDITAISKNLGIGLKKENLVAFEKANFKPNSAAKIQKLFKKDISLIAMKNDKGQKVSLCFLPENFNIPKCHSVERNGFTFNCGKGDDCEFTYWKQEGKIIALVSDSLTSDELIPLALPIVRQT